MKGFFLSILVLVSLLGALPIFLSVPWVLQLASAVLALTVVAVVYHVLSIEEDSLPENVLEFRPKGT